MAAALLLAAALVTQGTAGETAKTEEWNVGGVVYRDVRVRQVTPGSVLILHRNGLAQLSLADLSPDLQARFNYDPDQAHAWEARAGAELAATSAARQALERQRDAAGREAATARANPAAGEIKGDVPLYELVDLRPVYQKHGLYLRNQGRRPSCAVFAIVGALEYEIARRRGRVEPLSEEFLIWAARSLQPDIPLDDGFHFGEVLSALQNYGIPRQVTMRNTFGRSMDSIQPTPEAISEATLLRRVIPVWIRANDRLLVHRLVNQLNQGTPVVVGLKWPNWRTLEHTALLSEQTPMHEAGHAVTLVGYKSAHGSPESIVFIFRNSYGVRWGSGGHGYVTVDYLRKNLIQAFYLTLPDEKKAAVAQAN